MLLDKNFLKQLDKSHNKIVYVRIIALNLLEEPLETIEGKISAGSINIDGNSAIRRTCSLTLLTQNYNYNNHIWGLNTRFKLEIGLGNNINNNYDDIIWFNQGIYIITSFNTSRSANNFSISISGKDKMCLLNGEISGIFESEINFGEIEEEKVLSIGDKGEILDSVWEKRKIPIEDIIRNMVHTYAQEPIHNIIIKDLPNYGLELLEYRGEEPIYAYKQMGASQWTNILTYQDKDLTIYYNSKSYRLEDLPDEAFITLTDNLTIDTEPEISFSATGTKYALARFQYGDTSGYRTTELTYPGDLIAKAGESITSVLDKIKNTLVQFEYFYDLNGQFVFQKKKSFTGNLWSPVTKQDDNGWYIDTPLIDDDSVAYDFQNFELFTTFNNTPNINNLKNDYSIWGQRKGISGAAIPIHMRYAIDKKPTSYTTIKVNQSDVDPYNKKYQTYLKPQNSKTYTTESYDWRELIYKMASDYSKYNYLDDFETRIKNANPNLFPTGQTGYEQYYVDIQGFWRQLYNPNPKDEEIDNFFPASEVDPNKRYWNKSAFINPESLNFWFDFLDSENSELSKYSVRNIGSRPKVINDTKVKSIYYRDTPTIVFTDNYDNQIATGYFYAQLPSNYEDLFSISAQGASAKNKLDDLLYQHAFCVESVTINAIPIYYLEPNTLIRIKDEETHLNDNYIISKLTIPLTYNGTMAITASKAIQSLI